MFTGSIEHQTIIADEPVVVLDGDSIVNTFSRVEDATDFVVRSRRDTAFILKHNGRNWDVLPGRASPVT